MELTSRKEITMGEREQARALSEQLRIYFKAHPYMSFEEFTEFAKVEFLEVQAEYITPYIPIEVPDIQKNLRTYQADNVEEHTRGLEQVNLKDPKAIAAYRRKQRTNFNNL